MITSVSEDPIFEEGGTLMLSCCAEGHPLPSYAWIRLEGEMPSKAVGATSSNLFIPEVGVVDAGVYVCLAINEGGITQSNPIQTSLTSYGNSPFTNQ